MTLDGFLDINPEYKQITLNIDLKEGFDIPAFIEKLENNSDFNRCRGNCRCSSCKYSS